MNVRPVSARIWGSCRHKHDRSERCFAVSNNSERQERSSVPKYASGSLVLDLDIATKFLHDPLINARARRKRYPPYSNTSNVFLLFALAVVALPVFSFIGLCELAAKGTVAACWLASEFCNLCYGIVVKQAKLFSFNPWIVTNYALLPASLLLIGPPLACMLIDTSNKHMITASSNFLCSVFFPIYGIALCYALFGRGAASFAAAGSCLLRVWTLYKWCFLARHSSVTYTWLCAASFCTVFLWCFGMLSSAVWSQYPTVLQ